MHRNTETHTETDTTRQGGKHIIAAFCIALQFGHSWNQLMWCRQGWRQRAMQKCTQKQQTSYTENPCFPYNPTALKCQ